LLLLFCVLAEAPLLVSNIDGLLIRGETCEWGETCE
jgi:hypothetical protein